MEACPFCGSNDIDALEMGDCYACDLMECETCGEQFTRDEIVGVEHTDDCEAGSSRDGEDQ